MKKVTKLLSIITAVVMMLSLFAMPVGAAEGDPIYHNAFSVRRIRGTEAGTVETDFLGINERFDGQPPAIGNTQYFGDATYKFDNYTNAVVENGVLKMAGTGGSRYYWAPTTANLSAANDPHFEGDSVVTFSFMMPRVGYVEQLYRGMFAQALNSSTQNGGGPYINVLKNDAGTECFVTYGTEPSNKCFTIEPGRWYRLMLIMNKSTKSFDLFIDGVLVADNAGFSNTTNGTINGGLVYHRFYSNEGEVWYDDYMTYSLPAGKSVYFAEDFSGMVGRTADNARNPWYFANDTEISAFSNATVAKEEDGNAAITLAATGEGMAVMRLGASPASGRYGDTVARKGAVSFRFKLNGEGVDANLFNARIDGNSYGADLWVNGNTLYTSASGTNPNTTLKDDLVIGKWYNVIVNADFTDVTVNAKTGGHWAVYLAEDGGEYECLAMDVPYNWHPSANVHDYGFNTMGRAFEAYVYSTSGITYDDIVLYDDTREDILLEAGKKFVAEQNALSTTDKEIAAPASQAGYTLTWSAGGAAIAGNDTVNFAKAETEKAYTVTVVNDDANNNNKLTVARTFTIEIPRMYETSVSAAGGVATGTVKVNGNDAAASEGYADGLAILAIYDTATNKLVTAKPVTVTAGTATVTTDAITAAGSYSVKLFFMVDGALKPLVDTTDISSTTFTVVE